MKSAGFTLIEAMVAIGMVAILVAVGVPSLQTMLQNNQQNTRINELVAFIKFARTEAVKRGGRVTLCASSNMTSCNADSWEMGALMYMGDPTAGFAPNDDQLLRVLPAQADGTRLARVSPVSGVTAAGFQRGFISYEQSGRLASGNAGSFVLCDERGEDKARGLNINEIGQVSAGSDTNGDGVIELNINDTNNNPVAFACPS